MENNRMKELFELARETLANGDPTRQSGICAILRNMAKTEVITFDDRLHLLNYMKKNKPTKFNQYKELTKKHFWLNSSYWWYEIHLEPQTKQIRLDYLTMLINNI